jgi:hypothetical protein
MNTTNREWLFGIGTLVIAVVYHCLGISPASGELARGLTAYYSFDDALGNVLKE